MYVRIFILMVLVISSCRPATPPHPETVLGIKLGLPKAQMLEVFNSGKLKFENEKSYIDYGEFRGFLTVDSVVSSEGSFINAVRLKFVNPGLNLQQDSFSEYVSQININQIIISYETKYGNPKEIPEKKSLMQRREWEIGDLSIQLFTDCTLQLGNVQRCKAQVLYDFTSDAYKKFKVYLEKNNKGI